MNLEPILKYTGIGGLAIALLFLLFKDIIKKNIFSNLDQKHSYQILKLIIILIFIASSVCIVGYFVTLRVEAEAKAKKDSIKVDDHHINSNGDNNANISGNNNVVNLAGTTPAYDQNKIEIDSLAEFLEENDGRVVFLNIVLGSGDDPESYKTIDGFDYCKTSIELGSTEVNDKGDYKGLTFIAHTKSDYTYVDNEDQKKTKYYYWTEDETECTVIINNINKNLVYREHGLIIVKGRYLVNYYIGGQGHHVATLTPREST
ncbi:hypothetical protein OQX63_05910 [Pedobacter sp. PF22-3]|uniref:hypothetical protein n=1 Tax=Pedobacter sp. PF22-3 TaxID=2994467 RepID=UPI0022473B63|nr:hypothetical protein [Pedobacter sp. PF22-3]MCX2492997.1 hypothetical protein [Pedobacter sp. PF22-3]